MPTSPDKPSTPTEPPSKAGNDALATAPPTKAASPGHEEPAEATLTALAKKGGSSEAAGLPSGLTIPRPTKTVECNMMSYTDGEGVARQIYMPKGTMGVACALYAGKRFDALAKFPTWGE